MAALLQRHQVQFIVNGRQAEYNFGSPRLDKTASSYQARDLQLRGIDLDDLITIKKHINPSKDRERLLQLLAIKRIGEQTGKR